MVPAQPLFDSNALPGYPEEEEIKRRMRQLFIHVTQHGVTKRKIQDSMLATFPLAEPQDTWRRYTAIANSEELQGVLDHVLALHVRCLGQMILLVYAVRLQGNHGRMVHILYFIRDLLKTIDFEFKIPQLLNRYHKQMTAGLGNKVDPLPSTNDFSVAAANWLCYCHKAFELRDRAYHQYVLRYIYAVEKNDPTYRWIRLSNAKPDTERNDFYIVKRTTGKIVLFVDDDFSLSPIAKLLKPEVELIRIDSDNREVVIGTIRSYIPGMDTGHAVFWFGRQYICNGNRDYGNVIAEICDYYTTRFGQVRQYVVLPGYNRLHREVWTYQVLCLYLQKDVIAPHAQIVLHPYDAYLWQEDQDVIDNRRPLPAWSNPNQDEDAAYYKAGALEARKFNLLTQHRIDLFTWYQGKNIGEFPPAQVREYYLSKDISRPFPSPLTPHPGEGGSRPSVPVASTTASAPAPTKATTSPFRTTPPANIVNIFGEQLLVDAIQRVTQQAAAEIAAALDARLSRIEAMLQQRPDEQQPTATAEDRHRDRTRDW
ncbi:hypothetical protein AAVH_13912 [Aphelenchoides avenae]|nr:hypothetical protein AAVH_13912 [Aphelenchus avenae]